MDKIQLLQERKAKIAEAGKDIRARIQAIVDEESFVELSAFSFSKNEFYGEDVAGEGVVTGFATVDGYPLYIVAQNFKVMDGGISKAACEKIAKCLDTAEKNSTPILYLLNTRGVQVGEGNRFRRAWQSICQERKIKRNRTAIRRRGRRSLRLGSYVGGDCRFHVLYR